MPMNIQWTLTVEVPQLDAIHQTLVSIGEALVDTAQAVQAIKDEVARLNAGQAAGFAAIANQLNAILAEMQQYSAGAITDDQYAHLLAALTTAADNAEKQAADIEANTQQILGIVPDSPPA